MPLPCANKTNLPSTYNGHIDPWCSHSECVRRQVPVARFLKCERFGLMERHPRQLVESGPNDRHMPEMPQVSRASIILKKQSHSFISKHMQLPFGVSRWTSLLLDTRYFLFLCDIFPILNYALITIGLLTFRSITHHYRSRRSV